ncbi:sugar ABC transporter ATP-binding protein [Candidatus Aerophobetes bacterium]|uniref:Sugar ABC transporter ATP-binding protein n=1 Tax=Aerophobetes bacterium TaxID=2030807 RepID=A0A2A4X580_UNCAE|nr:MAG: sugar ABC transporter ATP-binding protein [Candidatus Aerophobetes bacterium]
MTTQEPSITLTGVSLELPVYGLSSRVLKKELVRFVTGGMFAKSKNSKTVSVRALNRVDLSISSGMRVGIIGHNGSGKSTLLKVISGIYHPTGGSIEVVGKVSSVLDLMCGIDPEISGRDNAISRGMLFGHSKKEMAQYMEELTEMTGLGDFMEMPVKTYSAGMMVRLAFAVSVMFKPEIFVIDEVFGAGDKDFAEKSRTKILSLIKQSKIFILASHNEELLKDHCTHLLWLDKGNIRFFGPCQEGLDFYHYN